MNRTALSIVMFALAVALPAFAAGGDGLREALQDPARPAADRERDALSKPVEVVELLGVEPKMTVVDLISAGGYWAEVMAGAVGPEGRVYAQNPKVVLEFRGGANEQAIAARLANGRLPNVARLDREVADLGLAPGSIDVAITSLNFHDIYNGTGPAAAQDFLKAVLAMLKPGGVLAIIDHQGIAGVDNAKLHRIPKSIVIEQAQAAGFELVTDSDLLANPADDHMLVVFDPALRGQTDRFLLKLRKPRS